MNFTRFDIVVIFSSVLAIVLMSFIMPATGLTTSDNVTGGEIPDFNITVDEWNVTGDFPEFPGTPNEGTVRYDERDGSGVTGQSLIWIDRPKDYGASLETQNLSNQLTLRVNNWSGGQIEGQDEYNINKEGQEITHQNSTNGYVIEFDVRELDGNLQPNMTAEIRFKIIEAPSGNSGGIIGAVLGWITDAGSAIFHSVAFVGLIIRWLVGTLFELAWAIATVSFQVMQFAVDTLVFLVTEYDAVVSSAKDWAVAITAIPGILLSLEFAKLAMIGVSLLPTT